MSWWWPAAALAVAVAGPCRPAHGVEYETLLTVTSESELDDAHERGLIAADERDALAALLRDGVDLERASRAQLYALPNLSRAEVDAIVAYRAAHGSIGDPGNLVAAGVVSARQLRALAPFLADREPTSVRRARGRLRVPLSWTPGAQGLPAGALRARLTAGELSAGVALAVTRQRLADLRSDPARAALSAAPPAPRLALPKLFVAWRGERAAVIAGSYRLGIGERLTFDDSGRPAPDGAQPDDALGRPGPLARACREAAGELPSPCTGAARYRYIVPDVRWHEGLRGLALELDRLAVGDGSLDVRAWGSYAARSVYQYELRDARACPHPGARVDPACAAPDVYLRGRSPGEPSTRAALQTLPDVYSEALAGASVSYRFDDRRHVGVAGYGAALDWRVAGAELDLQPWARTPFGGPFGAVGLHGGWGRGPLELAGELTRGLDSQGRGGGWAGLARALLITRDAELESGLRFYAADFANPYAHAPSQADERDGLRASDEAGVALRYARITEPWAVRAQLDLWTRANGSAPRAELVLRGERELARHGLGAWLRYRRDLGDHAGCEPAGEPDEAAAALCGGRGLRSALRYWFAAARRLSTSATLSLTWSDGSMPVRALSAWATGSVAPTDAVRARARLHYNYADACVGLPLSPRGGGVCLRELLTGGADDRRERSLAGHLELAYRVDRYELGARYELAWLLDDRDSTALRTPNPEHRLSLSLEARR